MEDKKVEAQVGDRSAEQQEKPRKRRNYKKELELVSNERDELKNQLLRRVAEFDNFRKRSLQEKSLLVEQANAELIRHLLPALDDLQRIIKAGETHKDFESLYQGIQMFEKKLLGVLESEGLEKMETIGHPFDPEKHDALLQQEHPDTDSDVILDEHKNGYEFKGNVLRHAQVIVSK